MENNWKTLGPKLQGKLHISVGDADVYYLNNAVHLLDDFLSHADPPFKRPDRLWARQGPRLDGRHHAANDEGNGASYSAGPQNN